MTLRRTLAFICMTCVAALASAGTPKFVDVPADDLTDAVELLAKQYEVDVIYPSDLLRGRQTRGVTGAFEAVDAFRKLLDGTPLVLSEEGDALLITQPSRPFQQATKRNPADGLPGVLVRAWREADDAGPRPSQKREPIFGWARHNAEKQAAVANAQALASNCQRLARTGDKKIQVYCTVHANPHPVRTHGALPAFTSFGPSRSVRTAGIPEAPSGRTSCRRLIKPGNNTIRSICGEVVLWEEFDVWAINAGVTCRFARTSQELCLTAAQWKNFDRPRVDNFDAPRWPGDPPKLDISAVLYSPMHPDGMPVPPTR